MIYPIKLKDIWYKLDPDNGRAMIYGFKTNNKETKQVIYCVGYDVWTGQNNNKLMTMQNPNGYKGHLNNATTINGVVPTTYKHVAICDTLYEINSTSTLWITLCSNGFFDIWKPSGPETNLNAAKNKYIGLFRIYEIGKALEDTNLIMDAKEKLFTKINTLNNTVNLINPVLSDNEFTVKKNQLEQILKDGSYLKNTKIGVDTVKEYPFNVLNSGINKPNVEQTAKMENYKKIVEEYKQVIFQGAPGTGKTRLAKELAYYIINNSVLLESENDRKQQMIELSKKEQFEFIQFHPSYSYEDFIRGIVVEPIGSQIKYEITNKILLKFAEKAIKDKNNPYVLIIDEINRANLPSVLGELIYALEYRDEPVNSVYLKDKDEKIILPSNLYIIGTMNTADRSVGQIDYAIRRRFVFITIDTNKAVIKSENGKKLFEKITQIFDKYTSPDFNKNDVKIGHSYFIGDDKKVEMNYKYQVLPILKEYLNDGVLVEEAKETIENEFQKWLERAL